MKKVLIALAVSATLAGCATDHYGSESKLFVEKRAQPMSRQQVIQAIQDCEVSKMRPILIMAKRRVNNWDTDIIIDVTCAPRGLSYY
jgi:type IV pilus biogenesis protein CpaD/CtpE